MTLAWKTLEKLMPTESPLVFDMRGPSPLHVDCFLVPDPEPNRTTPPRRTFEFRQTQPGPGYALAAFAYDPRAFPDNADAQEALFRELEVPADVYYEIEGAQERLELQWEDLESTRNRLVGLERATGLRGRTRRRFTASGVMRELAIELTEFEAEVEIGEAQGRALRHSLEDMPGLRFLYDEIDEGLATGFSFHTDRIVRLLDLFERRRLATSQNLTALVGAVLAAVIGATSALWVSGHQSSKNPTVTITTTQPAGSARPRQVTPTVIKAP